VRRLAVLAVASLAACAWSNSLYQARTLAHAAEQAERDHQPGLARNLWGQVSDKAQMAYTRSPGGARGAEALWLEGHAAVRAGDCRSAVPALHAAFSASVHARWEQQLLLELGECEETLGEPTAVSIYQTLLTITNDPAIRREARMHQGHVLVAEGDWERGVTALEGEDSFPARRDRAMALAQLGRTDQALIALGPDLAASDTAVRWLSYIDIFAVRNSAATDRLLDRIVAFPTWSAPRRAAFTMEAAQAAMVYDPDAAARRLQRLVPPGGAAPTQVLLLQQQLRLSRPGTPSELRGPADSIVVGDLSDAPPALRRLADLLGFARLLIAKNDSIVPGAPRGDLTIFALGEIARDSLAAPRLSAWYFARVEREWPQSPYVGKALFARIPLEPDSSEVLLARLRRLSSNPYVVAANGDAAGAVQLPRLEDSLSTFVAKLWASVPRGAAALDRP
jgi:hypothetical protein